jgi:xeroderma pigmentosum group C-complementing protein
VVSPQSEDNEGSLLSEDPEDEDAVPEWLMSD